jgi:hypothetical protein
MAQIHPRTVMAVNKSMTDLKLGRVINMQVTFIGFLPNPLYLHYNLCVTVSKIVLEWNDLLFRELSMLNNVYET